MKTPMRNEPADWDAVKAKIMQRHIVEGDCWEWKSFCIRGTVPVLHHKTTEGRNVASPVRKLVAYLWGKYVPPGYKCLTRCGNPMCVNPDHICLVQEKDHLKRAARSVARIHTSSLRAARIAETRRTKHAKLDWGKVAAIRESQQTYNELSKEYGVSKTVIGRIKRYEVWVDHMARTNPFRMLMR